MIIYWSAEGNQGKTKYARVVELVDSLDSGSSVHCGRAGSSPASRTIRDSCKAVSFFVRLGSPKGPKPLCFQRVWRYRGIFVSVAEPSSLLQLFTSVFADLAAQLPPDDKTSLIFHFLLFQNLAEF